MIKKYLFSLPFLASSTVAFAHPGHALTSLQAGFMHPFLGWDHLLMMIAVGLWASKKGGRNRWQLPSLFVGSMALGASLGFMGIGIAGIEIMIALGLVIMGFLLLTDQSMRMGMAIAFIAVIAMAHGFAHGVELIGQPYIASLVGMLLATTALHILGYLTGSLQGALASRLYEAFAAVMLVTGGLFFVN